MPSLLSDPPPGVIVASVVLTLVSMAVWRSRRDRTSLTVFLIVVGLTGAGLMCDRLFDSPREVAVRAVQELARAAEAADPDRFAVHLAESFHYHGEGNPVIVGREQLRRSPWWQLLKQYRVRVAVWDFARSDAEYLDRDTVEIGFLAKGEVDGRPYPFYLRARFARQADGTFRLTRLASFDPLQRQNGPRGIPYFP